MLNTDLHVRIKFRDAYTPLGGIIEHFHLIRCRAPESKPTKCGRIASGTISGNVGGGELKVRFFCAETCAFSVRASLEKRDISPKRKQQPKRRQGA
jgi:hypothetical protein